MLRDIADFGVTLYGGLHIKVFLNRKFVMTIRSWSMLFTGNFKRQGRAAFIACLLFAAPSLMALGLGEITLNSSLNEPLDADIVVLNSADLDEGQLLVSLASSESFERAGISRDFFLNQILFT